MWFLPSGPGWNPKPINNSLTEKMYVNGSTIVPNLPVESLDVALLGEGA